MRSIIGLIVMTLILMIVVGCYNTSNDVMIDEQTIIESNNSYDSILYNLESINGEICSIKMIDNNQCWQGCGEMSTHGPGKGGGFGSTFGRVIWED